MSSSAERIEIFSAIQRRRRYSVDQKLAVLAEAAQPGMTIPTGIRREAGCLGVAGLALATHGATAART
jgi:transposase-like protein